MPLLVGVALVVFAADQLTKAWALDRLADGDIELIFGWRFHLVRNPAAAFSLGGGLGPVIGILALGVVATLVIMSRDYPRRLPTVFVGMIVGGALGNVADRLFRSSDGFLGGEVIDFIDVGFWPVFNVADSAVVVGVILLAGYTMFFPEQAEAESPDPENGADALDTGEEGDGAGSDSHSLAAGLDDAVESDSAGPELDHSDIDPGP
ncbi:MAG: signal peptidase II [Acidimicrobiales bacterium]